MPANNPRINKITTSSIKVKPIELLERHLFILFKMRHISIIDSIT